MSHSSEPSVRLNYRPSGVGSRLLLESQQINGGLNKAGLAGGTAGPDTIRILAIRVEFVSDDLSTTTGDGTFDLSPGGEVNIDPPPHDRAYFQAQLLALANYYRSVSNGKLILTGDVFPLDSDGAYQLPNEMVYYNPPQATEAFRDKALSELFRDAVLAADADSAVSFRRYQSIIVFHAGVGQDFAFDFDPTPNDIPSVFLDRETLAVGLAGQPEPELWPGIPVDDGVVHITEGIILPETQSQEGFEIGLLGTACLMFGHQLGLPVLWDPDTGRPGIGMWGLMDQGSGNASGLLPAQPCAWSRIALGWVRPIEIRQGQDIPVAAWRTYDPRKVYKIPINSHEYFLVENRQRDVTGDKIAIGKDVNGNRVEIKFDQDGNLQLLHEGRLAVITQVDEYDFGLPGSGILIWHIDEEILQRRRSENRVNVDPEHRAIDLEEADGAQDIGQAYGFLSAGSGSENGVPEDAFWAGNEINQLVNDSPVVEFTPFTEPNSDSYSGANSNIYLTDFSDLDTVMTFSVRTGALQPGFPVYCGAPLVAPPLLTDLDLDGTDELISATADGRLVCWRGDGQPFLPGGELVPYVTVTGDTSWYPDATVFSIGDTEVFLPSSFRNDDKPVVVWGSARTGLYFLQPSVVSDSLHFVAPVRVVVGQGVAALSGPASWRSPTDTVYTVLPFSDGLHLAALGGWDETAGQWTELMSTTLFSGTTFVSFASLGDGGFVVVSEDGILCRMSPKFEPVWNVQVADGRAHVVTADIDGDGSLEIVTLSLGGVVDVFSTEGDRLSGFPTRSFGPCPAPPALGDVDGQGAYEIAFVTEGGRIFVLTRNGLPLSGWPVLLPGGEDVVLSPILFDIDGDGSAELFVPDQAGGLAAFAADGKPVPGFPMATAKVAARAAATGDLDGDGQLELAVAGEDGFLYVWRTEAVPAAAAWPQYLHNAQHSGFLPVPGQPPQPETTGRSLIPEDRVHCYPNPTNGNTAHIRFYLSADADVSVKIYDLAGAKIAELSGRGLGTAENEIVWNVSGVASGVYLANVKARSEGRSESANIKIVVTK